MKVVDKNGKLFGKLNVIDLIVIVLILAAIVVVAVKLLGGIDSENEGEVDSEYVAANMTYTVRVEAQRPELAEWVISYLDSTEDHREQLVASGEMLDAYIVDWWTEPTQYIWSSEGDLQYLDTETAEEVGLLDICFCIEANCVEDLTYNTVGTQEVRVGRTHIVKTLHFEFTTGVTESCTWEMLSQEDVDALKAAE